MKQQKGGVGGGIDEMRKKQRREGRRQDVDSQL